MTHNASVARNTLLIVLAALTLLAGALFVAAPKVSAAKSECPSNSVCIWSGANFTGNFSHWAETNNGCKSHVENPKFKSGWNNTNLKVKFGNFGSTPPGESFTTGGIASKAKSAGRHRRQSS
jgi:hypothetical protein